MYKTLKEAWGLETKFTQSLKSDIDSLNRITALVGLPKVETAENEYAIPGGAIDVVGFTAKGEAIVFEHQDLGGRADQTHVNKTVGYPHKLIDKGIKVLGSILMCESVDEHYVDQFQRERKEYARRKYNGHKNLHIVKSQWTEDNVYEPTLFNDNEIIRVEDSRPLKEFRDFYKIYAREWDIRGEENRPGLVTLWFRDISRGDHYIHKLKNSIKIGIHFKSPNAEELELVDSLGGRHLQTKSTIEYVLPIESTFEDWFNEAEKLKRSIRKQLDK